MNIVGEYCSKLFLFEYSVIVEVVTMSQTPRKRWNSGPSTPSSKKKKYMCKFQDEWAKAHSWLQSSSLGVEMAYCTLCSSHFSVAHSGLYDIKRHSETALHKKAVTSTAKTTAIDSFLPPRPTIDYQVIRAETLFSNFVSVINIMFMQ